MAEIIKNSNNSYDLKVIVHTKDDRSEHILEYFSSIKARVDVAAILE
jgi:pyruvate carboxylase